jgi:hypothetical protein
MLRAKQFFVESCTFPLHIKDAENILRGGNAMQIGRKVRMFHRNNLLPPSQEYFSTFRMAAASSSNWNHYTSLYDTTSHNTLHVHHRDSTISHPTLCYKPTRENGGKTKKKKRTLRHNCGS